MCDGGQRKKKKKKRHDKIVSMKPFIKENKGGEGDAQNDMLPK